MRVYCSVNTTVMKAKRPIGMVFRLMYRGQWPVNLKMRERQSLA